MSVLVWITHINTVTWTKKSNIIYAHTLPIQDFENSLRPCHQWAHERIHHELAVVVTPLGEKTPHTSTSKPYFQVHE